MLEYFNNFIEKSSYRNIQLLNLDKFNNNILRQSYNYISKQLTNKSTSTTSKACQYINNLIKLFNINDENIINLNSNVSLNTFLDNIIDQYQVTLQAYYKKPILHDTFIKSNSIFVTNEIILPLVNVFPFKYYSFNYDDLYLSLFSSPMSLLVSNSYEYTLYVENGQLVYNNIFPDYVIILLDIKYLLYKWCKYVIYCKNNKKNISISHFYHFYILLPFVYQSQISWIINLLNSCIDNFIIILDNEDYSSKDLINNILYSYDSRFSYIKDIIKYFLLDVNNSLIMIKNHEIDISDFLYNFNILKDIKFISWINYLINLSPFNNISYYLWINVLKDFNIIELIYSLLLIQNKDNIITKFKNKLLYLVNRYYSNKIWIYIKDIFLKNYIKKDVLMKLENMC